MNKKAKELLMKTVVNGSYSDVQNAFKKYFVHDDKSYFDYELLLAALKRNHEPITHFLVYKTSCRAGNPTRAKAEETPLHLAVKLDNPHIIKKLINKQALVFDKDENGDIPLLAAFKNKKMTAVQALLTYYMPDCKPDDKDAMIHFHIACVTNHRAASRYLKCGLDPNSVISLKLKKYSGYNPVHLTAEKDYYPLFQELLRSGADLSIKTPAGLTPLHIIYYTYETNTVKSRIKQIFDIGNHTKFINAEDNNGVSHLHLCCILNKPDLVQVFIDNGENLNCSTSLSCQMNPGFTPLHFAIADAWDEVIELLLKNGADCNKQDKDGRTPLHFACNLWSSQRRVRIIKMLLDHKANPAISDNKGYTAFHIVFCLQNSENKNRIFDLLLPKLSENANYTNDQGLSHFHIACTNNINQVKDFLESGVDVNSSVSSGIYSGYTGLHFAALYNQKDIVELLLKMNAQVNVKTKELQVTPLHLACEFNYAKFIDESLKLKLRYFEPFPINLNSISSSTNQFDVISMLLLHGAHVNAKDSEGVTPLLHTSMIDRNFCNLNWTYTSCSSKFKSGLGILISSRLINIIKMLLSNKAKMNVCSNKKESILHAISKYSFLENTEELVELILTKGVHIEGGDDAGLTPLHVAVKAKNQRMVNKLLKHEASVHIKCKNSEIPLHSLDHSYSTYSYYYDEWKTMSVRNIYIALLEKGSDANILVGESKSIPLHNAVSNKNKQIVSKLLCNGADINMEDSSGNSCISSLLLRKCELRNDHVIAEIFQIVFIHVQKLLALKLYVSEKVLEICRTLEAIYEIVWPLFRLNGHTDLNDLENIFTDCKRELKKLKLRKIDNRTSLYNILLKNERQLTKYVKNEKFIKTVEDEKIDDDFPFYSDMLKLQFRRGSMRNTLLPIAKEAIFSLINNFGINLPDLCSDIVVKYLKNEDLANLKAAVPPKRSLKRKLKDAGSLTTEKKARL